MGIADVSPQIANERLGAILTRQAVIDAATRQYLAGQSLDMSALAAELGIGRSTLYRIVGNRENLLGTLLAQATERTFRRATTYTIAEGGSEYVLGYWTGSCTRSRRRPLRTLSNAACCSYSSCYCRSQVEQTAGRLIGDMLATEVAAGRSNYPAAAVCGDAIVGCASHLYARHGRGNPRLTPPWI
jgi:AcrR family transcriptional regulator